MEFTFEYNRNKNNTGPGIHHATADEVIVNGKVHYRVTYLDMPPFTVSFLLIPNASYMYWAQIKEKGDEDHQEDFIRAIGKGIEEHI